MKKPEDIIPPQVEGGHKDFEYERVCDNVQDAQKLFEQSRTKLMDINNWHLVGGKATAVFMVTNNYGLEQKHSVAHEGLYIKIDIPGPGLTATGGYDWVHIERVVAGKINDEEEFAAIKVRPVKAPDHNDGSIMHFFSHKATSTFVLKRVDNKVLIHYAGRNEVVNTEGDNFIDELRNVAVGVSARLGLSDVQWTNLIKGIIGL